MAKAKTAKQTALTLDLERARAHWLARQGLATPVKGTIEEVLARTSWGRTLGGVDVYLAVRARIPALRRKDLDAAVEASRIQVIPAVRGCIYLVPRAHVPLALRVAEELARKRLDAETAKAGVKPGELEAVGTAVVKVLARGALGTDALRKALPEGTVRSLGDAGKKVGLSSTLPPALRLLEFAGLIERTLEGGRLDTERYLWRKAKQSPFEGAKVPAEAADRHAQLAGLFAAQCGPVTVNDFAAWSGLGKRDALAAVEKRGLVPVEVTGYAPEAYVREEDLPDLRKPAPSVAGASFLSFEDSYLTHHGGPAAVTDLRHHDREMKSWGMPGKTRLGDAAHIQTRSFVLDGLLAGFWEYDPSKKQIAYHAFDAIPAKRKAEVAKAADELAEFIAEELGHARSFSLDTDAQVQERARHVRSLT